MLKFIKNRLAKLRRDDEGSVVIESVIMFPTLFVVVMATFVFFDAFRNQSINLKANYTIADSLSRQTDYITNTFMTNTWLMHRFLTSSPNLTRLRISVIDYDADTDSHSVVWSRAKGGGDDYNDTSIATIGLVKTDIPIMPNNEILIVVQTSVDFAPYYAIGLEGFTFENTTYTRHRWSPNNLCYSVNGTDSGRICPGDS
ncbi:hypothetical protein Q4555_11120 [Octadecabacter sp. 1_MG-2023]|uniref:TadE/TadG family type IV pilus assembly protein n=1 Tax=unclassified Octadecabacter TaxID=196158 RepID=UPI001C0917FE|nr:MULTISPECIES: hypothetical protein [unclassified Octadecabacter]MBU2993934.1 hypothetical protein [Octadecabacter sp. B2R22]MDO6735220.1 hypothetical protein [Octadecabacter sp. 1_MG-2023]